MNDLATLKRAMDAPPGYTPAELDLGAIVAAGSRIRCRRRIIAGTASAAAVAAILIGGTQLVPGRDTPVRVAAGASSVAPSIGPSIGLASAPASSPADQYVPYGAVIDTGLTTQGGGWVLYAVRVSEVHTAPFGIMLGIRQSDGRITPSVQINETEGRALAPGFHEGEGPQNLDGRDTLAFGYYVGKPYRIVAKVHGKQVSARFRSWSENPAVTVFWFRTADAGPDAAITGLAAYDRQGQKLIAGNPTFGLG
jgi:hypothetical protein